jgi:uncharacterized UPF0160 family protein
MNHYFKSHGRSFIDCEESKFDVILSATDAILYHYEESWAEDEEGEVQEEFLQLTKTHLGLLRKQYLKLQSK